MDNLKYLEYVNACHSTIPTTVRSEVDSTREGDSWAVRGQMGGFKWWAYSSVYHPDYHVLDEQKKAANRDFKIKMSLPGAFVGFDFLGAMSGDEEICNISRQPVVLNVSAYKVGAGKIALEKFEQILYESIGQTQDVFYFNQQHQQMAVRQPLIMGKDLVFPAYTASEIMLSNFAMFAPDLIRAGANTVIGVFICRIKPSIDGRSPEYLPEGYNIPIIQNPGGLW